jgi:HEAT repeat protein
MSDHPSLARLRTARGKYEISSARLDTLASAPEPFVVDALVVEMTSDDRWLVRHSAIRALGNAVGEGVEDALLRAAERAKGPQDLVYINAALGKAGSHRSLAHLTQAVSHRKEDVATSALAALRRSAATRSSRAF